jgi:hypothetical protein
MTVVFEKLFEKSNWSPIEYNGEQVSISDTIDLPVRRVRLIIRFEQVNSDWEQGIFLKGKGTFFINNERVTDSIYLWQKTSPDTVECIYESTDSKLKIWNTWRIDNGSMQYGHNGAALYYQETKNGKRYYCNDGYPDDDFNDLIFSIEIDADSQKK